MRYGWNKVVGALQRRHRAHRACRAVIALPVLSVQADVFMRRPSSQQQAARRRRGWRPARRALALARSARVAPAISLFAEHDPAQLVVEKVVGAVAAVLPAPVGGNFSALADDHCAARRLWRRRRRAARRGVWRGRRRWARARRKRRRLRRQRRRRRAVGARAARAGPCGAVVAARGNVHDPILLKVHVRRLAERRLASGLIAPQRRAQLPKVGKAVQLRADQRRRRGGRRRRRRRQRRRGGAGRQRRARRRARRRRQWRRSARRAGRRRQRR